MRNSFGWLLTGWLVLTVLGALPAAQREEPKPVAEKKYAEVPTRVANRSVERKPASKQVVEVKLWVVELNLTKLRALGFDAGATATAGESPAKTRDSTRDFKVLEALQKNGLAQFIATPMIATRSGRAASLEMDRQLRIEVTPVVLSEEQVELEYRIEVDTATGSKPGSTERRLITAYTTELASGEITCLSETTTRRRDEQGKAIESKLVVLAKAKAVD